MLALLLRHPDRILPSLIDRIIMLYTSVLNVALDKTLVLNSVENKDYLMRQLESLGEALRKLLAKVPLLKESEATDIQIAEFSELMKAEIGLSLNDTITLSNEAFLTSLLDKKMTGADLSNMINLLVELAAVENVLLPANHSTQLLSKAVFLGDYLTTNQKMVYFGNVAALDQAKRLLK